MTGRSVVNRASNSRSGRPCGCSVSSTRRIRSTTLTTRTRRSGRCWRRSATAASVSSVGMSPAAGHHDVRVAVVVAGPVPDADAAGAVQDRLVHRQVVERRLLAGDDDVDVVPAAQAVIGDREQAVRVRRQVDPDDLGLLVHDVVDEARVLVAEAVVVLAPDVAGQQVVERGDRAGARGSRGSSSATWRAG